ncbi:MAG: N-acetylmuramoyl-L-alanine amidase [Cellulosilyticaceae bacterium]
MYKKIINIMAAVIMFIGAKEIRAEVMELIYDGESYLYDLPPITLLINEQRVETKIMPPIQLEGATLVPVREVFEPLGAFVEWKVIEKKVYIDYQDTLLILEVDRKEAWINGEWQMMDMPVKIINGKIMVPVRFISEQIGFEVKWVQETREIYITDKEEQENIVSEDIDDSEDANEIIALSEFMMAYDQVEKELGVYLPSTFEIRDIRVEENYIDKTIKVDLNGDYSYYFGEGRVAIQDENIKAIAVDTQETTQIILELVRWHEVEILNEKEGLHIRFIRPNEKYDKIILLDAGHGGNAPGSIGNQLVEKEVNLKQTLAVKNFIEANTDIKVYLTRSGDSSLSVEARPEIANDLGTDIFISIHNNSAVAIEANGIEVLYYPDEWDTRSEEMASLLQEKLILYTGLRDRGIKPGADLWVLKMSKMPAVLIEGGFLSNANDASCLASEDFTMQYAYAVYEAVVEIFNTMSFR